MSPHLLIAAVSTWAMVYAVVVGQWREAFMLLGLFVAVMFLAGSRNR
jgi:hypothetical protein